MQVEIEFLTQNAKRLSIEKYTPKSVISFSFRFERGGDVRRFKKCIDRSFSDLLLGFTSYRKKLNLHLLSDVCINIAE